MSYWDWLPLEMQEYVLKIRDTQALTERRESRLNRQLCYEIRQYGQLREKWGLGHIRVMPQGIKKCTDDGYVIKFRYLHIYGEFKNSRGEKQKQFLAFDFRKALGLCNAVKGDSSFHRRRFGNFEVRVINVGF